MRVKKDTVSVFRFQATRHLEDWNTGVLEYWSDGFDT
jgi:hypothetical protein